VSDMGAYRIAPQRTASPVPSRRLRGEFQLGRRRGCLLKRRVVSALSNLCSWTRVFPLGTAEYTARQTSGSRYIMP